MHMWVHACTDGPYMYMWVYPHAHMHANEDTQVYTHAHVCILTYSHTHNCLKKCFEDYANIVNQNKKLQELIQTVSLCQQFTKY